MLAMTLCLSVTGQSSVKTAERNELDFGMGGSFKLLLKGNTGMFKIRELFETVDLENFATTSRSRSCRQQNSSTVELVDHTYNGRRVV